MMEDSRQFQIGNGKNMLYTVIIYFVIGYYFFNNRTPVKETVKKRAVSWFLPSNDP